MAACLTAATLLPSKTRLAPLRKFVPRPPCLVSDEFAVHFKKSEPEDKAGRLAERTTPLARAMVEGVPKDSRWYLAALCYSSGEATSLASGISRGQVRREHRGRVRPMVRQEREQPRRLLAQTAH